MQGKWVSVAASEVRPGDRLYTGERPPYDKVTVTAVEETTVPVLVSTGAPGYSKVVGRSAGVIIHTSRWSTVKDARQGVGVYRLKNVED